MGAGNPGWNGLHPMYSADLLRIAGDASGVTPVLAWSYFYRPGARRPPAWHEPRRVDSSGPAIAGNRTLGWASCRLALSGWPQATRHSRH